MSSKKNQQIRVMLTSSGGSIAYGRVQQLKNNPEFDFFILGVDSAENSFKLPYIDAQEKVPSGKDKNYLSSIIKLAKKYKIDIIVPASDYETLIISKNKKGLNKLGFSALCSNYNVTKMAIDKGEMLLHLKESGIPVPKFYLPKNLEGLRAAARKLGYPKKAIIFKPSFSGGGNRGVWVVKEKFGKEFLNTKNVPFISLTELSKQLSLLTNFPKVILMDYLTGEEYSVDALSGEGKPIYIVPRVRVNPLPGYSQEGLIKENLKVKQYVSEISKAFGFDSNFNVQLMYSASSVPLIYEINPRVSATIVANRAAGIDLLAFGIYKELGIEFPTDLRLKKTRMVRFWKEFYCNG